MESLKNRKIQLILLVILISTVILITAYAFYKQSNPNTEASSTKVQLKDYQPEMIIEKETETLLLNGAGFNEDCQFLLGNTNLESTFINTESVELILPDEILSETLKVTCGASQDLIELQVEAKLKELPE